MKIMTKLNLLSTGIVVVVAAAILGIGAWAVLLGLPFGKEAIPVSRMLFLRETGVIIFIVLCLNALIVSLFGRHLLKRIKATADCVNRIENGDFSARIDAIPVRDEIGRLQEGINAMGARIEQRALEQKKTEKALRVREARIRRLVDSNVIGIFLWDLQGNITDANDAFLDMIGYGRDELAAGKVRWTHMTPAEFGEMDARKAEEVRRTHTCTPYEKEFLRKDGSRVPVLLGAAMFEGEDDTENGVAFVLDLTERKRTEAALRAAHGELETRVRKRTADLQRSNRQLEVEIRERRQAEAILAQRSEELARSNAELEQLAYVASHDLQEPLRMIASYLQLLERRFNGRLDEEEREFMGFAVDGARRMQSLIDDLLTYSRVGTRNVSLQPTDSGKVVARVLHALQVAIRETGATVECGPLPVVVADPAQLAQLFQNLVANAIKFHGDAPPDIRIRAEETEGAWCFAVQDNGIGIASEYFERIFVMFQRLHVRREYPGTGIGLAICKKIVERHGGHIWVESAPGQGTTFRFTIPYPPLDTGQDRLETGPHALP